MCDEKLWQLATKVRRYCHGGQNAIFFFRRTIVDIATMSLSFKKKITRDMGIPYYNVICMVPYYNVIW
jgi:hypothetical protein